MPVFISQQWITTVVVLKSNLDNETMVTIEIKLNLWLRAPKGATPVN